MTRQDIPDEELMAGLGAVLKAEVDGVEPASDSLARIRARTASSDGRRSVRWLAPLAAAAAVVAIASAALLLPNGDRTASAPGIAPSTDPTTPSLVSPTPNSTRSPTPLSSPSGSVTPDCAGAGAAAVYYSAPQTLADRPNPDPRLYREFVHVSGCMPPIDDAVSALLSREPTDPDYQSNWAPDARLISVATQGNLAIVDITRFTLGDSGGDVAIKQLVWTVTAADPRINRVLVKIQGEPVSQEYGDWTTPQVRGNALETLANVWILDPTQGERVSSPVTVHVWGTGYEGNVPLKVFKNGAEVASTFVTTEMGRFREASTTIDLPPGTYELRAYNDNGKDATLMLWDTKTFTVR